MRGTGKLQSKPISTSTHSCTQGGLQCGGGTVLHTCNVVGGSVAHTPVLSEAKGDNQSPALSHSSTPETGFPMKPSSVFAALMSLPCTALLSLWVLGGPVQALTLEQQMLLPLSHFPNPKGRSLRSFVCTPESVCMCMELLIAGCRWKSEDNLQESLLPPTVWSWRLNSGEHAWQRALLPSEAPRQPS